MINLDSILGTCVNVVHEFTDINGVTGYVIEWDIPYIMRAAVLLLSLWFFYRLIISFVGRIGGRI